MNFMPTVVSRLPIALSITAKIVARWVALLRSSVAVPETPCCAKAELKAACAWAAVKNCAGFEPLEKSSSWKTLEKTFSNVVMLKMM